MVVASWVIGIVQISPMNMHNIHKILKNNKYKSNYIISRKCHLVIFRLYLIASAGSNHLSITAYSVNFNLTAAIIHGIIKHTIHKLIIADNKIVHSKYFRILSRVYALK